MQLTCHKDYPSSDDEFKVLLQVLEQVQQANS
jgi:hypothetical protein